MPAQAALPANRPNILVLVSDDQPLSMFTRRLMPSLFENVVDRGMRFDRFYVNSPVCCPSRSEIMTGLNEQHTGVDDNGAALLRPTIVEALDDLGYRTVLSGKYVNSHPCSQPRPEFDAWLCQGQGPFGYELTDPTLHLNGRSIDYTGYTTEIQADYLVDQIRLSEPGQPFFAMYTPPSPHLPAHDDRYASMPVPWTVPPNFDEDTQTRRKPFYMRRGPLTSGELARATARHATMARAVRGLDDSIGSILDAIADEEQETLVFFLSDNGFLLGEHRRWAKMVPYEESVHMPFAVWFPPMIPEDAALRSEALTSNIDIAPTIADVVDIPWGADGRSLVPLFRQRLRPIHDAVLINWCMGIHTCAGNKPSTAFLEPQLSIPSYFGVVTRRYKYVEYRTGEEELYDLRNDPYEMENHAGRPAWADVQAEMANVLASLTSLPRPETTIVSGPAGAETASTFTVRYFTQSRFGTYECRLDRNGSVGVWSECDGQQTRIGPLSDGDYTFSVRGTDERGRTDATPATIMFSLDATAR
jgi:N-acetylglucosamine-6-sulfatase